MKTDKRYAVNKEFSGYATQRYVVRFCGKWVGSADARINALKLCSQHNNEKS